MGSKYFKSSTNKGKPALLQLRKIKDSLNNVGVVKKSVTGFEIKFSLQPTPLSKSYNIRLEYIENSLVRVFVIDEILAIAPNRDKLPHVYNSEKQQLCLYTPAKKEWNPKKVIAETIIPWASEWLYYYELWLPEGKWYGGGHNEYETDFTKREA